MTRAFVKVPGFNDWIRASEVVQVEVATAADGRATVRIHLRTKPFVPSNNEYICNTREAAIETANAFMRVLDPEPPEVDPYRT